VVAIAGRSSHGAPGIIQKETKSYVSTCPNTRRNSVPHVAAGGSIRPGIDRGTGQDASGAVLPGVTVEAASPALIE